MVTRLVSGVTLTLESPFSFSSMIQMVSVPSALRPSLLVELLETEDFLPEPNLGFSP